MSLFLWGFWDEVTQGQHNLGVISLFCPPLLFTPKEETGGGVLNATFLLRAFFFFYTEVYPLSSHAHLDWIEKL